MGTTTTPVTAMTRADMITTIRSVQPGQKLRIIFNSDTSNSSFMRDLRGNLYMIMSMDGKSIQFPDMGLLTLKAVADSGAWEGCDKYVISILPSFDPAYFIARAINRELLVSVRIED